MLYPYQYWKAMSGGRRTKLMTGEKSRTDAGLPSRGWFNVSPRRRGERPNIAGPMVPRQPTSTSCIISVIRVYSTPTQPRGMPNLSFIAVVIRYGYEYSQRKTGIRSTHEASESPVVQMRKCGRNRHLKGLCQKLRDAAHRRLLPQPQPLAFAMLCACTAVM